MKQDAREGSGLTVDVDLGDRWSRYCVLDPQGQILEEDMIATTGPASRKLFGDRAAARVVIEVGTHSPWVQRLLHELGDETITANPRHVRLIYSGRNTNDQLDAERLARLARVHASPSSATSAPEHTTVRRDTAYRTLDRRPCRRGPIPEPEPAGVIPQGGPENWFDSRPGAGHPPFAVR